MTHWLRQLIARRHRFQLRHARSTTEPPRSIDRVCVCVVACPTALQSYTSRVWRARASSHFPHISRAPRRRPIITTTSLHHHHHTSLGRHHIEQSVSILHFLFGQMPYRAVRRPRVSIADRRRLRTTRLAHAFAYDLRNCCAPASCGQRP